MQAWVRFAGLNELPKRWQPGVALPKKIRWTEVDILMRCSVDCQRCQMGYMFDPKTGEHSKVRTMPGFRKQADQRRGDG